MEYLAKKLVNKALVAVLICFIAGMPSCKNNFQIQEVSQKEWVSDKNGCNGYRKTVADLIYNQRAKIYGVSEDEFLSFFGRPDRQDLRARGQKFFLYYLSGNGKCAETPEKVSILKIRFNAINSISEVFISSVENDTIQ